MALSDTGGHEGRSVLQMIDFDHHRMFDDTVNFALSRTPNAVFAIDAELR